MSSALRTGAYLLVALLGLFELWVGWLALHPQVAPDYRAYYIDQTTTCLNQPVSGDYRLGTLISFRDDGAAEAKPVRVCGWEGPVGDGTHAVGTSSRLRFVTGPETGPLALSLELIAVRKAGHPQQRVEVMVNAQKVGEAIVGPDAPRSFSFDVPVAADGRYEVELKFPTAVQMGPTDAPTRYRSIKLLSAGLVERG